MKPERGREGGNKGYVGGGELSSKEGGREGERKGRTWNTILPHLSQPEKDGHKHSDVSQGAHKGAEGRALVLVRKTIELFLVPKGGREGGKK